MLPVLSSSPKGNLECLESNWDRLGEDDMSSLLSGRLNFKENELGLVTAVLDAPPEERDFTLK